MDDISLAHSRYNCTYHIVFIPKYRRKAMFGETYGGTVVNMSTYTDNYV
ncbi:MAG: hypothetical protein NC123_20675, partial [Butyrivibrio sp.]|nr:hypothetical protein [Butyrivibrio sp.]